jgi:hypothetical protein
LLRPKPGCSGGGYEITIGVIMTEIGKARMGMIAVAVVMLESVARRLMGTRRLLSGVMTLVAAGMVLLVAAGGASANGACIGDVTGTVFGPGSTVTESCTFNASMDCSDPTLHGLIVGADGITINGAGYTLRGTVAGTDCPYSRESNPSSHCGIINNGNHDNVVIRNLEIENFCTGIGLGSDITSQDIDNNEITGCVLHDCGSNSAASTHGIHLVGVNNCMITNNEIYNIEGMGIGGGCGAGGNGIFLYGVNRDRGNHNIIDGNELHDNIKSGFFNALAGIYIGGKNNTIRYNIVTNNNVCGINMGRSDGSYNNEVYENTACGNKDADIITCGSQCYGNHGYDNTCDTTSNYDDDGTTGCTFSCSPPEKPDLTITAKSKTLTGSTLKVTYTVTNNGGGDAGASTTGIYVGGMQVATDSVGALAAGASHTSTVTIGSFNCPCGTTVTIKVCADNDGAVDESDETNNCCENVFNCPLCPGEPQLCPIPDHNFGTVQPGQTETWQFGVTNCGGAGTLTWIASDNQDWITVDPTSGTDAGTVTVTIKTAGLSDGTHTGTVTVASDYGTETGTISVNVQTSPPAEVPTFTPIGMFALVGLLGIAGIGVINRR